MNVAKPRPTLDVGDRLEGNQGSSPLGRREYRQFRPIHQFHALDRAIARHLDADLQFIVLVDVEHQRAPQGNAAFAGPCPGLDMRLDSRRPVAVDVACRRQRCGMRERVVRCRHAQRMEVRETLEDGANRIACTGRDLRRRRQRSLRVFPNDGQVGFDDELLRSLAAKSTPIYPDVLRGSREARGRVDPAHPSSELAAEFQAATVRTGTQFNSILNTNLHPRGGPSQNRATIAS